MKRCDQISEGSSDDTRLTHLQLDRFSGEALPNKRGLVDHPLPALALVLARLDDLEHLLLGDASNLGQGHGILGGAIFSSVLDGR